MQSKTLQEAKLRELLSAWAQASSIGDGPEDDLEDDDDDDWDEDEDLDDWDEDDEDDDDDDDERPAAEF